MIPKKNNNDALLSVGLIILFIVNPFISFVLSLISFYYWGNIKERRVVFYVIISAFFGLLAYTQRSTGVEATDITRYYDYFKEFENIPIYDFKSLFYNLNITYIAFDIISRVIISITNNVQVFSLFWTFLFYFLFFLSIENYITYNGGSFGKRQWFALVVLSVLSFIMLPQVSETVKQSSSMAFFFYGFSSGLLGDKKKSFLFICLALLCHLSSILLFLMYVPKYVGKKGLIIVLVISILVGFANIMNIAGLLISKITGESYLVEILTHKAEKYSDSVEGFSISAVFLLQLVIFAFLTFIPYFKKSYYNSSFSIAFLCVLLLNISVPHNFDRFMNLASFPLAMVFVDIMSCVRLKNGKELLCIVILLFAFTLLTTRKVYFRTLDKHGYTSSYLDNSVSSILISPVSTYLNYEYYE